MLIQKAIQQINFTENLERRQNNEDLIINVNTICFLLLKKRKKPFWIFHKEL